MNATLGFILMVLVTNVTLPVTAFLCGFVVAKGRLPRRGDFRRPRA